LPLKDQRLYVVKWAANALIGAIADCDSYARSNLMQAEIDKLPSNQGQLSIHIEAKADMNFSAVAARRKVTGFVVDEISTQLGGREPTLVVGERIRWRVPIRLSLPHIGDLGEVGAIEVDVETGQMNITEALIQEITLRAEELAKRISRSPTT
jgi:hypothetical protein